MTTFNIRMPFELRAPRETVWAPAMAMVVFLAIYFPMATTFTYPTVHAPASFSLAASHTAIAAPDTVLACTPMANVVPTQLNLADAHTGLTVRTDPTAYYQIYGSTADDLRNQIQHCAPGAQSQAGAEYTGETNYTLTWQYDTTIGNGCSLTDVKVGLHNATTLPLWQSEADATPELANGWQRFVSSLATHEQGHATLNERYAAQLVSDLEHVQNVSCGQLTAAVNRVVTRDAALLNQANADYDAQTNHGATQGAVLPSN
ncbi:MAG TPA: DUF922 domain-containing protein [Candidatus Saccharimonadales bacterium]|nr:DUF922 domain-containing protein [Candidatus Saccharimonadales bacterium]